MSGGSSGLAEQFRRHFDHDEHLYGVWLGMLADDLEAGGPTAEICRDHLDASRGAAVHLRLLAAVFRVVLRGEAPALEHYYPCLGGTADATGSWPHLREVLASHAAELRRGLDLAPQTNEVGRSACLVVVLVEAVRRHGRHRVRLLEPGASAGLNLLVDHYRVVGRDWAWGPEDSALRLDTGAEGLDVPSVEIVQRRGCDLAPVDAATPEGATYLTSFVWPFDLVRHERLAAALQVVRDHPVVVDRAPAEEWLAERLAEPVDDDVLTVVWQSITEQYWPAETSAAVAAALAEARGRIPLAHVSMEGVPPAQLPGGYSVAEHGPDLRVDGYVIARSHHHGPPVILATAAG